MDSRAIPLLEFESELGCSSWLSVFPLSVLDSRL
jgi:hypothetical protein